MYPGNDGTDQIILKGVYVPKSSVIVTRAQDLTDSPPFKATATWMHGNAITVYSASSRLFASTVAPFCDRAAVEVHLLYSRDVDKANLFSATMVISRSNAPYTVVCKSLVVHNRVDSIFHCFIFFSSLFTITRTIPLCSNGQDAQ